MENSRIRLNAVVVGAGVVIVVLAGIALAVSLAAARPGAAQQRLGAAVESGDVATVDKLLDPALRAALSKDTTQSAAGIVIAHFPDIASLRLEEVSRSKVRLVNPESSKVRLELRKSGGWKVSSASYFETQIVVEPLSFPDTVNPTPYLPRGTRIVVTKQVLGKAERTFRVLKHDGREISRIESGFEVRTKPITGEVYEGVGTRGKAVTNLLVGSRFDREAIRVTNNGSTVNAKDGRLAATWRMKNPVSGDQQRLVLLGPSAHVNLSDSKTLRSASWVERGTSFSMPDGKPWAPKGEWIVIVETNGSPGAWRVVTVK